MEKENTKEAEIGSAFDLLFKSWELVKKNWQMFLVVNVLVIIGAILQPFQDDSGNKHSTLYGVGPSSGTDSFMSLDLGLSVGLSFLLGLIVAFIFLFLNAMGTRLELLASQGKTPQLQELVEAGKKYWFRLLLLMIASFVIVVVGLLLLIVPGVIAIGRLLLAPYVMVDKDLGVFDSIRQSNRMATGRAMAVWSVIGVMILVGIVALVLNKVPAVGPLVATAIGIIFSLVIPLRYLQIKKLAS